MHGEGTIIYADRSQWTGAFKYNRKHGLGIFTVLDGHSQPLKYYWDWTAR